MRCTLAAFLQSCALLLVRADQWRLKESCELNRKVSPSSPLPPQSSAASSTKPIRLQNSETTTEGFSLRWNGSSAGVNSDTPVCVLLIRLLLSGLLISHYQSVSSV